MISSLILPQTVHAYRINPSVVCVAAVTTTPSSHICSAFPLTTSCPHVDACQWYSASFVHSSEKLCLSTDAAVISSLILPQTVHAYRINPSVVCVAAVTTTPSSHICSAFPLTTSCPHVDTCQWYSASFVHSVLNEWPVAGITSVYVSSHVLQEKVLTPFSEHVAALVMTPSSHLWNGSRK